MEKAEQLTTWQLLLEKSEKKVQYLHNRHSSTKFCWPCKNSSKKKGDCLGGNQFNFTVFVFVPKKLRTFFLFWIKTNTFKKQETKMN